MNKLSQVRWIALAASIVAASACSSGGGSSTTTSTSTSTGTGGNTMGTGGSGGTHTGGSGGAASSSSSGTGGTGGAMCGIDEKVCGAACRLTIDPSVGCADPSCAPCTNDHGTTACAKGVCAPTCYLGWADCDGDPKNGCEHDVLGDAKSCGACGNACAPGFVCEQGSCSCGGSDAACDGGGATPGTFTCPAITGPDVCACGGVTCAAGQRCQANGMCG